jgi:general secretion pathway protein J
MVNKSHKGFTLLELMISITLIGIVMLIVFGTMRLGYRSIEKAERTMEFLERVRTSLGIIESQLQSQIPLTYEEDGEKKMYFVGRKESIQFSTNHSIWSGQMGYVKVAYNVEQDGLGKLALYATENTISVQDTRKTMLLDNLDSVSFKYFYKDPTMEKGEWREEWPEKSTLPEFVTLNISDSSRKFSINLFIRIKNIDLQSLPAQESSREPGRQIPKRGKEQTGGVN